MNQATCRCGAVFTATLRNTTWCSCGCRREHDKKSARERVAAAPPRVVEFGQRAKVEDTSEPVWGGRCEALALEMVAEGPLPMLDLCRHMTRIHRWSYSVTLNAVAFGEGRYFRHVNGRWAVMPWLLSRSA